MAPTTLSVRLRDAAYDIHVGEGLLDELPELLSQACPAPAYAVITDSAVRPLYGERLIRALAARARCVPLTFPAGEWNKTRETWASLTDGLLAAGLGRDAAVIALGGGVTGDLAGFVAATYLRGVPYVQVPTTLLAMIDSSIGGKTGVDTPAGKNLVGAFHQPQLVAADLATLRTLPAPHLATGMAEALKHGVIADAAYFERLLAERDAILRRDPDALHALVTRSIEIKRAIVTADERERGPRALLNFGHTVAHALETVSGYELLHGEAVAIGMRVEAELGCAVHVTDAALPETLHAALEAFALPTTLPGGVDVDAVLNVMRRDKKVRDATVRFALPKRLGDMARAPDGGWTIRVPEGAIADTLRDLLESSE